MIVGFDLDDTLYPEITYVHSGFRAVAEWLDAAAGCPADVSFRIMTDSLEANGRGAQFDDVLQHWGLCTRQRVQEALSVYRAHHPDISLPESSQQVLRELGATRALYLVTDGNHRVQARKVDALGVAPYFEHCYLTNRYGRSSAKPSTRTFELMLSREQAPAERLIYVGDNPAKDFVGVRGLGGKTIRVRTGAHRDVVALPGHDADVTVHDITSVVDAVLSFEASLG